MSLAVDKRNTLFELDFPIRQEFWCNYQGPTWHYKFNNYQEATAFDFGSGGFGYGSFGGSGIDDLGDDRQTVQIGSVNADSIPLIPTSDIQDMLDTEGSFYVTNDTVYIHLPNSDWPNTYVIDIGQIEGFAQFDTYLSNVFYDGRITSLPTFGQKRDPLFFGLIQFQGGAVGMTNHDARFDDLVRTRDIFGQACRLLFQRTEEEGYQILYRGNVEDFEISYTDFRVQFSDIRKHLSRTLPVNYFSQNDWPDLRKKWHDKPIPLTYGALNGAPAVCLNEDESPAPSTYYFQLGDGERHDIKAINQVYVNDVAVSHSDEDLAQLQFSLSSGDFSPGNKVKADMQGYVDEAGELIDNSLDVIVDLLGLYASLPYNDSVYDTTEWDAATLEVPDIGLHIQKDTTIIKAIEDISLSAFGNFMVKRDGRYTFRRAGVDKIPDRFIREDEVIADPEVVYDSQEYLTSAIADYDRDWSDKEFVSFLDDTREVEIFSRYKTFRQKTFETLHTIESDAEAFTEQVMDLSDTIWPLINVVTKMQSFDLNLFDWLGITLNRLDGSEWFGGIAVEVEGIEFDLEAYTVTLALRQIADQVTVTVESSTITITANDVQVSVVVPGAAYYGEPYYGAVLYGDV